MASRVTLAESRSVAEFGVAAKLACSKMRPKDMIKFMAHRDPVDRDLILIVHYKEARTSQGAYKWLRDKLDTSLVPKISKEGTALEVVPNDRDLTVLWDPNSECNKEPTKVAEQAGESAGSATGGQVAGPAQYSSVLGGRSSSPPGSAPPKRSRTANTGVPPPQHPPDWIPGIAVPYLRPPSDNDEVHDAQDG